MAERPRPRGHARSQTQRDLERFLRRRPGGFWRAVGLVGSVGWPIVLLAVGGALLGRYLDERLQTGVRFTLMLVTLGTALGSLAAYRAVRQGESR